MSEDKRLQVCHDLKFPSGHNACFLYQAPHRWDEFLDLEIPIFISGSCGDWPELCHALWEAGLGPNHTVRLAQADGRVESCKLGEDGSDRSPDSEDWWLILNWTHEDEGWRSRLPLAGRHYLVTRQKKQGEAMVCRLEELGATVHQCPTIEFQQPDDPTILSEALDILQQYDWILFTSPNGVRYFFEALTESGADYRKLGQAHFACIGPGTAKALKAHGFKADLIPEEFVAEGLLDALEKRLGPDLSDLSILIPRAQEAREVLPETLRERGARVLVAPAYKTVSPTPKPDVESVITEQTRVLFTSSSTVKNWLQARPKAPQPCICIGPVTAATAAEAGLTILGTAPVHTIDGLLEEVLRIDGQGTTD